MSDLLTSMLMLILGLAMWMPMILVADAWHDRAMRPWCVLTSVVLIWVSAICVYVALT